MIRKIAPALAVVVLISGCALYSDVSVAPLHLSPANIERGADLHAAMRRGDFLRAIELAPNAESRARRSANDLFSIGRAYLACGRYDEARARLRMALNLEPNRTVYGQIAWSLSQLEYLANNYEASLEWANIADSNGLSIKNWHLEYLQALAATPVYTFSGAPSAKAPLRFGRPDIPRVDVKVNGHHPVQAIIDTGAVLSIVSARFADSLPIQPLGTMKGEFFGLLGEPIEVSFGLLESVHIGDMAIRNVPVAIMPDEKMRFLISRKTNEEFRMDFLLGVNLLKELRLELNFDHNRLTVTRLTDADRRPAVDQNVFFESFRPHIRAAVNNRGWYIFLLDTGSEVTFLNDVHIASVPIYQMAPRAHSAMLQGLGGSQKRGAKVEDVTIGVDRWAGTFKTIPMYTGDEKEHAVGIIGENYLKNFNVVLDFGRMRLDLQRR